MFFHFALEEFQQGIFNFHCFIFSTYYRRCNETSRRREQKTSSRVDPENTTAHKCARRKFGKYSFNYYRPSLRISILRTWWKVQPWISSNSSWKKESKSESYGLYFVIYSFVFLHFSFIFRHISPIFLHFSWDFKTITIPPPIWARGLGKIPVFPLKMLWDLEKFRAFPL